MISSGQLVGECVFTAVNNTISAKFILQLESGSFRPSDLGMGLSEDLARIEIGFQSDKLSFSFTRQDIDGNGCKPSYSFDLGPKEGMQTINLLSKLSYFEQTDERIKTAKNLLGELATILEHKFDIRRATDIHEEQAACNNEAAVHILKSIKAALGKKREEWEKILR